MASRNSSVLVAKTVFAVLFAAILVFCIGAALEWRALNRMADAFERQAGAASSALENHDYASAYTALNEVRESLDGLEKRLDAPLWQLAGRLPVVSSDVACLRGAIALGDELLDDALLPLLDSVQFLINDKGVPDVALLAKANITQVVGILGAVAHATDAVDACKKGLEELPEPHLERLRDVVGDLRTVVYRADDALVPLDAVLTQLREIAGAVVGF